MKITKFISKLRKRNEGRYDLSEKLSEEPDEDVESTGDELDLYQVSDYAWIRIKNTAPPVYEVLEPPLSSGEKGLLEEIKARLYDIIDIKLSNLDSPEDLLREKVKEVLRWYEIEIDPKRLDKIMYYIRRDFLGYGKIDPILRDKRVEDISVDGPNLPLYVFHRNYESLKSNVEFKEGELDSMIHRLSQLAGKHISMANPLVDATLPTKDRVQLSLGSEVTTRGSTFTIRKFRTIPLTPIDLINTGTFSTQMMAYLWMAVENGKNILISGGAATGKTTVLNAISMFIPSESKIVSIEDTREINLLHKNWVPSVTRELEETGRSIDMFSLLRTALRQRPEYILVGEVRGREAHTLFQAMATGHVTFSTLHADSMDAIVRRLTKPPIDVPLMLLDGIDVVCIQRSVKIGSGKERRCDQMREVTGIDFDNETITSNELFRWLPSDEFEFTGESKVFVEIMEVRNMDEYELAKEFEDRTRVLEWMREKGMSEFEEISTIVFEYNRSPEKVMGMINKDEKI